MSSPVFDGEEWRIERSKERTEFGGLLNEVVVLRDGGEWTTMIHVPVGLLKYLREVTKAETLEDVWLYVEQAPDNGFLFGYVHDGDAVDLWRYREKAFPAWAEQRRR